MRNSDKMTLVLVTTLLVLQHVAAASTITTVVSNYVSDGPLSEALFISPRGLAADPVNNLLYVSGK
jgi:hypothetical protein